MIEMMDLAPFLIIFVLGVTSTIVLTMLIDKLANAKMKGRAGKISQEKMAAQEHRLMLFLGEATELFTRMKNEGKEPKEMLKEGAILALKYHDVVIKHGKKLIEMLGSVAGEEVSIGSMLGLEK